MWESCAANSIRGCFNFYSNSLPTRCQLISANMFSNSVDLSGDGQGAKHDTPFNTYSHLLHFLASACNLQSFNVLKFFLFLTAKTGHWYNIFLLIKSWLIKFSGILFQYSCENEVLAKMKKEPCCTTTGLGGWVSSQLCQWYCRRPQKG